MARYTEKLLATLRDRYENTGQTILSIAAEFDISSRNLQRLVITHGWAKRSKRVHDVPRAQRLLEEAEALAIRHPEVRAQRASKGDGPNESQEPGPHPSRLGATRLTPQDDGHSSETPSSAIDRIEALVLKEIEAEETVRKLFRGKRRVATTSERNARTLATLTQTLQALKKLRAGDAPEAGPIDNDDMPEDIDEFRNELARRIRAFVASRTDRDDAGGDAATPVVEVR